MKTREELEQMIESRACRLTEEQKIPFHHIAIIKIAMRSMLPLNEELQAQLDRQEELLHTMANERLDCEMPLINERDNLQRQNEELRKGLKLCAGQPHGYFASQALTQADSIAKELETK